MDKYTDQPASNYFLLYFLYKIEYNFYVCLSNTCVYLAKRTAPLQMAYLKLQPDTIDYNYKGSSTWPKVSQQTLQMSSKRRGDVVRELLLGYPGTFIDRMSKIFRN